MLTKRFIYVIVALSHIMPGNIKNPNGFCAQSGQFIVPDIEDKPLARQYKNPEFGFIPIRPPGEQYVRYGEDCISDGKVPIGYKNIHENALPFNDDRLIEIWNQGKNLAITCARGNLAILDEDELDLFENAGVIANLPPTFSVKTGSGGFHKYFQYTIPESGTIYPVKKYVLYDPDSGEHAGELQVDRHYCVIAGSKHTSGNEYVVDRDDDILTIDWDELIEILKPMINDIDVNPTHIDPVTVSNKTIVHLEHEYAKHEHDGTHAFNLAVPLDEIGCVPINITGQDSDGNVLGTHPLHGHTKRHQSKSHNFSVNSYTNTWHCFSHNTGGGWVQWLAITMGIIKCSDSKPGSIRGDDFVKVIKHAIDLGFKVPSMRPKVTKCSRIAEHRIIVDDMPDELPDNQVVLIRGPPRIGKTYRLMEELIKAGEGNYITTRHSIIGHALKIFENLGGRGAVWIEGKLRDDMCIFAKKSKQDEDGEKYPNVADFTHPNDSNELVGDNDDDDDHFVEPRCIDCKYCVTKENRAEVTKKVLNLLKRTPNLTKYDVPDGMCPYQTLRIAEQYAPYCFTVVNFIDDLKKRKLYELDEDPVVQSFYPGCGDLFEYGFTPTACSTISMNHISRNLGIHHKPPIITPPGDANNNHISNQQSCDNIYTRPSVGHKPRRRVDRIINQIENLDVTSESEDLLLIFTKKLVELSGFFSEYGEVIHSPKPYNDLNVTDNIPDNHNNIKPNVEICDIIHERLRDLPQISVQQFNKMIKTLDKFDTASKDRFSREHNSDRLIDYYASMAIPFRAKPVAWHISKQKSILSLIGDNNRPILYQQWASNLSKESRVIIVGGINSEMYAQTFDDHMVVEISNFKFKDNYIVIPYDSQQIPTIAKNCCIDQDRKSKKDTKQQIRNPVMILTGTKAEQHAMGGALKDKAFCTKDGESMDIMKQYIGGYINIFYANSVISRGLDVPWYNTMIVKSSSFATPFWSASIKALREREQMEQDGIEIPEEYFDVNEHSEDIRNAILEDETTNCCLRITPTNSSFRLDPKVIMIPAHDSWRLRKYLDGQISMNPLSNTTLVYKTYDLKVAAEIIRTQLSNQSIFDAPDPTTMDLTKTNIHIKRNIDGRWYSAVSKKRLIELWDNAMKTMDTNITARKEAKRVESAGGDIIEYLKNSNSWRSKEDIRRAIKTRRHDITLALQDLVYKGIIDVINGNKKTPRYKLKPKQPGE